MSYSHYIFKILNFIHHQNTFNSLKEVNQALFAWSLKKCPLPPPPPVYVLVNYPSSFKEVVLCNYLNKVACRKFGHPTQTSEIYLLILIFSRLKNNFVTFVDELWVIFQLLNYGFIIFFFVTRLQQLQTLHLVCLVRSSIVTNLGQGIRSYGILPYLNDSIS